jgi:hypothetical protein
MAFSGLNQFAADPSKAENLNDPSSFPPRGALGSLQYYNGAWYRYVQHDQGSGVVATANGNPAYWKNKAAWLVTGDKTDCEDGAAIPSGCAGVYLAIVTHLNFTWIQMTGIHPSVLVNGNGAVGDMVQTNSADDGTNQLVVAVWGTVNKQMVGVQKAIGASNRAKVDLQLPLGS